ncbi:MAG: DUF3467 domain-containing protein [Anaerolineae bacterium]|nr:DUF3467 domain-containing protein [Anaerolineae bacterium]
MSNKPPHGMKINIEMPPDLEATYANFAIISHTHSEIIIDFARVLPNMPKSRVHARIVMTPVHAKLLLQALQQNLERYESQFGEITPPSGGSDLAHQFFGGAKPPEKP